MKFSSNWRIKRSSLFLLLQLAKSDMVDRHAVELYLKSSEKGRLLVEKYFNLTQPLYLDFTHLVCRTALDVTGNQELIKC